MQGWHVQIHGVAHAWPLGSFATTCTFHWKLTRHMQRSMAPQGRRIGCYCIQWQWWPVPASTWSLLSGNANVEAIIIPCLSRAGSQEKGPIIPIRPLFMSVYHHCQGCRQGNAGLSLWDRGSPSLIWPSNKIPSSFRSLCHIFLCCFLCPNPWNVRAVSILVA